MLVETRAIILSKHKYSDNALIVKCYTQELGVVSVMLRNISKSKHMQAAYFQLLSQLKLVVLYKKPRSLQTIKDVQLESIYYSLHTHVLKSTIVMFLSEVLANILKEEEANAMLFDYIKTTLLWLDTNDECVNFHLLFLLQLTKYLGFYPDTTNSDAPFFNLKEGRFEVLEQGAHSISGALLVLFKTLLHTTFDTLSTVKICSKQRQAFLSTMLLYFKWHLGKFKPIRSLSVFNQVFS